MDAYDDARDLTRVRQPDQATRDTDSGARTPDHQLLQLQRLAGNAAVNQLMVEDESEVVRRAIGGRGGPIEPALRARMEGALGHDFTDVRVHTGGDAALSAQRLGAHAYTVGNDVVFGAGRYDPSTTSGQRTLAHELTHVVQQRSGPVEGTDTGTGVKVSDPGDRFERAAEANADPVMAGLDARLDDNASGGDGGVVAEMSLQREGIPEEEEMPM